MISNYNLLYFLAGAMALVLSFASCPVFRWIAIRFNVIDAPTSAVKTHKQPTPYLGGAAIGLAFFVSLSTIRFISDYPTGTLRPIQGIFMGGALMLALGLVDDIVRGGLSYRIKFLIQFAACALLFMFGIQIHFIQPNWLAWTITFLWVVGVMNAMNIIDIMDGLSSSVAVVASLAFLFISLPTEHIFVNLTAATLAGAVLGFLPYNFWPSKKMFMGDTGSLLLGFVLASLSLGTSYSTFHHAGVLAPILILGVPIYDTLFVMLIRYKKGRSPFLGSRDHFALRLEKMGFNRKEIVLVSVAVSVVLSFCAWITTWVWFWYAVALYAAMLGIACLVGAWLAKVQIES